MDNREDRRSKGAVSVPVAYACIAAAEGRCESMPHEERKEWGWWGAGGGGGGGGGGVGGGEELWKEGTNEM